MDLQRHAGPRKRDPRDHHRRPRGPLRADVLDVELDHSERRRGASADRGKDHVARLDREHDRRDRERRDGALLPSSPLQRQQQRGRRQCDHPKYDAHAVESKVEAAAEPQRSERELLRRAHGEPEHGDGGERGPCPRGRDHARDALTEARRCRRHNRGGYGQRYWREQRYWRHSRLRVFSRGRGGRASPGRDSTCLEPADVAIAGRESRAANPACTTGWLEPSQAGR